MCRGKLSVPREVGPGDSYVCLKWQNLKSETTQDPWNTADTSMLHTELEGLMFPLLCFSLALVQAFPTSFPLLLCFFYATVG